MKEGVAACIYDVPLTTSGTPLIVVDGMTLDDVAANVQFGCQLEGAAFEDITAVTFNAQQAIGIRIVGCANLVSFSAPLLEIFFDTVSLADLPQLRVVNFPLLVNCPYGFVLLYNTGVETMTLPALLHCHAGILITNNSALTEFSMPNVLFSAGSSCLFSGNALSASCVNAILARGVASSDFTSGVLDLSDGTNAAPSGQGITDKNTLIARGVTVTTN